MKSPFFQEFLMISTFQTVLLIALLIGLFVLMYYFQKKKYSFSKRMLTATGLGLILGLCIQATAKFSATPMEITFVVETTKWYSLFGNGFIDLIRMLVIPLIMVSIVHVIINMDDGTHINKLVKTTLLIMIAMVSVAVMVGFAIGILFNLGGNSISVNGTAKLREIQSLVDIIRDLIPANPVTAMTSSNIIALIIFAAFFGVAAKRMSKKYMETVKPFIDLTNALHKIIISVAMSIIKWMPYAVIPLLANTIAQRGLDSILEVGLFIIALYIGLIIMFCIQLLILSINGFNPLTYVKKAIPALILAFTSRSSIGCLPFTVNTLTQKLGVNNGTASFIAGLSTTAGMQGCAGVFPAMLLVYIANLNGITIDISFILMTIIVVTIGSFGIAGVPGTSTMAATVALTGTNLGHLFPMASPILAVDPIIDMGRTALNVSGAMVNAILVDKTLHGINMTTYNDLNLAKNDYEETA
ncbi:MAG: sodium:dicarboxylate symporter [Candidatus Epulonipiscioides saccharophilum]|nr:MAG: sodium:dicarboxylate symporter [Epulopiscium sp. AS2M-Bin001]